MATTTVTRPVPHVSYVRRGQCLGKRNPACTARTHGTQAAYVRGCRCPHATNDHRVYQKRLREGRNIPRRVDATGTKRKIQALWALGHTSAAIGVEAGISTNHVCRIAVYPDVVSYGTWHAIDRAFRALSAMPGPSDRTRNRARRAGYAPPAAWDDIDDPNEQPKVDADRTPSDAYDPITVGLAVDGRLTYEQLAAHQPDLIEAVRRLATRMQDKEIADHLQWPGRNDKRGHSSSRAVNAVMKLRQRHDIPPCPQVGCPIPHRRKRRPKGA